MEKNTAGVAAFFPWPFDMSELRNTLRRDGDKSVHVYIARRQYNGNHEGINVCQKRYQESRPTQTLKHFFNFENRSSNQDYYFGPIEFFFTGLPTKQHSNTQ